MNSNSVTTKVFMAEEDWDTAYGHTRIPDSQNKTSQAITRVHKEVNWSDPQTAFKKEVMVIGPLGNQYAGTHQAGGSAPEASNRRESTKRISSRTFKRCLLYTSPSPRDGLLSRMPSSA